MNDSAQLIAELNAAADDLTARSTVSDACYATLMRNAAAVLDIARHVAADELGLARNRLAAHVRQVAAISANAEHAVILVEQAAARARVVEAERAEIIERIKSWCQSNGVPAAVVAA